MDTKLLIVDDDRNICDILKMYFENEGYKVKTANDGAEGVSYFKMHLPCLLVSPPRSPEFPQHWKQELKTHSL